MRLPMFDNYEKFKKEIKRYDEWGNPDV